MSYFYPGTSALRGGKRRGPLRHLAILVRDPAFGVGRPSYGHTAVADVDVRMVVLALRELPEAHHEVDRRGERRELELPHQRIVLFRPVGHRWSIPGPGRANLSRSYKTAKECVSRVTGTSYVGRGAATERPRPRCFPATGAMPGGLRSPSPGGGRSRTTWLRTASSGRSPRSGASTSGVPSGRGCTGSSPTRRSTSCAPSG